MDITELYCNVDDFNQDHRSLWDEILPPLLEGLRKRKRKTTQKRKRKSNLSLSESMTILIYFHQSHYRNFKHFYIGYVCVHLRGEFPTLVSYNRFVELTREVLVPLCFYLRSLYGACNGLSFIDTTRLQVCYPQRAHCHKVFEGLATWGKTSMGWFFGFKVHLVINEQGEILAFTLTPGNTDDRNPVPELVRDLWGKLFGDKGYISGPLFERLFQNGIQLVTKIRKNMKNKMMNMFDKLMLRKRALIESVVDH